MSDIAQKSAQAQANHETFPLPRPTDGTVAWRLEIDEFLTADKDVTNLFFLALDAMQKEGLVDSKGNKNWWSYYSLAGIHGQPREDWFGIPQSDDPNTTYCHHGMTTFPTWHRAYIFQFEQAVYNKMVVIAKTFQNDYQKRYLAATAKFRLPYWDISMPRHDNDSQASENAKKDVSWFWGLPDILKTENIFVRKPTKPEELVPLANPLYLYKFPAASDYVRTKRTELNQQTMTGEQGRVFDTADISRARTQGIWNANSPGALHTVRAPTEMTKNKGDSDYSVLERTVQLQTRLMTTYVWQLLTPDGVNDKGDQLNQKRPWEAFSKHTKFPEGKGWYDRNRSLESWHDNIHMLIGTGRFYAGQMSDTSVAAFDPIFWLHHNNIERLLCLYQSLYPDKFVKAGTVSQDGSDGVNILADDQLYPFLKDAKANKCFTSTELRDWTKSGYAIPGDKDSPGVAKTVAQYLRDTYYWATDKTAKPNFKALQFPKDLSHVEALTGKSDTAPLFQMKAIAMTNGNPTFVSRTLAAPGAKIEEKVQDPAVVAKALKKGEQDFPDGALIDVEKETNTKMNTWNAHLRIKKYFYDGSFNIHFFIGDISSARPDHFMVRMNEVGYSGIFASSSHANCKNCERNRDAGIIYEDAVPLTNSIIDYLENNPISDGLIPDAEHGTIRDLSAEQVVPFLKENLSWRITDTKGQLLDYSPGSDLTVVVAGRIFVPPQGDILLGRYGPARAYGAITAGKGGGYSGQDYDMSS